jgi:phenylacetate-CoA ligase
MSQESKVRWLVYNRSPQFVRNWVVTRFSQKRGRAKFGPRFHEWIADLARTQWYTTSALEQLQTERLRRIVRYAYEYVPYYRRTFDDAGIAPDQIQSPDDLTVLPVLEKRDLQQYGEELRSELYRDHPGVELLQSSGTTGRPVRVWIDNDCLQIEKAFTWLHRSWVGLKVGDLTAGFVGFPLVPLRQKRPPFWVFDRSENRMMYSLQHLSRANLPHYVESLCELSPRMVYGYPTAIYLVAQYLNETGVDRVRPRGVFTASETLMPHQRAEIEAAFGCRVMDWYGASEMIANIVQCEAGSYHVKQEYGVVEILRPDGTRADHGEQGTLVGTGLNNLAMPLLRYRVGDVAIPRSGECPCGRGGPLVEDVTGRVEDVVVTPDGRWLTRLDFIFKGISEVEEAQLLQHTVEKLRIRVVKKPHYDDGVERRITARLRERLGDEIELEFEYVDRIPRTRTGKFRYVISKVALSSRTSSQTGEVTGIADEEEQTS